MICGTANECDDRREAEQTIEADLKLQVVELLSSGAINPWCSICGAKSDQWIYDLGRSRFRTMKDALPHLKQNETEQMILNLLLGNNQHPPVKQ